MPKQGGTNDARSGDLGALSISDLLRTVGLDTAAAQRAGRAALERAGLTRPGKVGIAAYKRQAALDVIERAFVRVCGAACKQLAHAPRTPVITTSGSCEVCRGSNNRRAALQARAALATAGISRLLVIGGTKQNQRDLAALLEGDGLRIEFVDGTSASHSQKEAIANMNRAQMAMIWASTPLRHAVSELYTRETPPHVRMLTVGRRGIEALCQEVAASCSGAARRRR
jgi:hypothetical protein